MKSGGAEERAKRGIADKLSKTRPKENDRAQEALHKVRLNRSD